MPLYVYNAEISFVISTGFQKSHTFSCGAATFDKRTMTKIQNMIYLDNSATTKQYDEVTDVMLQFMRCDFGNPSSLYQLGVDAEKAIKKSRKQILSCAGFEGSLSFGGKSSGTGRSFEDYDVIFTSGGTEADNTAIFGIAESMKRRGNRIVTTAVEHPAVLEPLKKLENEGFEVIRVGVDGSCMPILEALESAINDETVLVSVMHVNNEVGSILPIDKVREIMRKNKAPGLLHCDAVQSFGKMPLPKSADVLSISGHKIHGPKGSGALLVRRGLNIPAFIVGGGQESGMRSGTENVPAIVGFAKAAEMANAGEKGFAKAAAMANAEEKGFAKAAEMANSGDKGFAKAAEMANAGEKGFAKAAAMANAVSGEGGVEERAALADMIELAGLRDMLREELKANIDDIIINSPSSECCPTILNVSFRGTRGEVLLHTLEQSEIYVSTGSACSSNKKGQSHVLKAMGLSDKDIEGTLRFSLGRFNNEEDIAITVEKVREAVKRFRRLGSFR